MVIGACTTPMATTLGQTELEKLTALSDDLGFEVHHRFVTVDGLRIHYAEAGVGEPVVLLHGWPQHWWEWRHVMGPLAERFRVICPDIRGLGWSEGDGTGYSFERLARDLVALMDHLGLRRVRLVGRDWGLVVGYRACLNWPERFESFVAMAGAHPWTLDGVRPIALVRPWHVYLLGMLGGWRALQDTLVARSFHAWRRHGHFTPEAVDVYRSRMGTPAARAATVAFNRSVTLREIPHFARYYRSLRLRVPTLHLNGVVDPLSEGVPESFHKYADDMKLEWVPNCGHFIPEEQPEWLVERLFAFFAPKGHEHIARTTLDSRGSAHPSTAAEVSLHDGAR